MNIQDELENDRLAVDAEAPHVFMRQDLYRELLDTSMFPYALRAICLSRWKKWLLIVLATLFPSKYEKLVMEGQFKFYLSRLTDYVNEERIKVLGMNPASVVKTLNFTVVDTEARPLYVGMYMQENDEFFLRQYLGQPTRWSNVNNES